MCEESASIESNSQSPHTYRSARNGINFWYSS